MADVQKEPSSRRPHTVCDGAHLKQAFRAATAWLEVHAEEINALNVFPVPDGDTGTNMLLTCMAAREEMDRSGDTLPEVMRAIAHGALMGARGNSGVILSQILRGMARSIDGKTSLNVADAAASLQEGASTAYKGVIKPVEGTILTVIREVAAQAAVTAAETRDLAALLDVIVASAHASVQRTPSLLLALRQAGVVDAGGYGLFILLQGIQRWVAGESVTTAQVGRVQLAQHEAPHEGYGYDVQFIVQGDNLNVDAIRSHIDSMGDSTLVVGDQNTIKVHIHVANPGPVLQYAATLGPLSRVIIENMQQQFQEFQAAAQAAKDVGAPKAVQQLTASQAAGAAQLTGISTIVVAHGEGFEKLFKSLDVTVIVRGGQTMNPSTQQILEAIQQAPTDKVVILPNNKNIIMAAQTAQGLSSKSVVIIPTKTIPQGIAALLALNYDADLETNRQAMEKAANRVRTAEITVAVRDSHLDGVQVQNGQIIGLVDDVLVAAGHDLTKVVMDTLCYLVGEDTELLTLYYGQGVQLADAEVLTTRVRSAYPSVEVELAEGGQPHYTYIISAE